MPRLFFHLGCPKTASTYLQEEIFPLLPLRLRVKSAHPGFTRLHPRQWEAGNLVCEALSRTPAVWQIPGLLENLTGIDDGRDVLVSNEHFLAWWWPPHHTAAHLATLREALPHYEIQAICVVRRQDLRIGSSFAQLSDGMLDPGQSAFEAHTRDLLDPFGRRYLEGMSYDHGEMARQLHAVLPPERILFLPHEMLLADPPGFLARLLAFLGLDPALAAEITQGTQRKNVRSTEANSWRTRRFSRLAANAARRDVAARAFHFALRRLRKPPIIRMTTALSREILSGFEPSNREFEATTGVELGRYGYYPG